MQLRWKGRKVPKHDKACDFLRWLLKDKDAGTASRHFTDAHMFQY
jgi:hypothetical protein